MTAILLSSVIFCLLIQVVYLYGKDFLSCDHQECSCQRYVLDCNFTDKDIYIPASIPVELHHVKIYGTNFSIHIQDQNYDDSWSVLETLELNGNVENRQHHLELPYKFTCKLWKLKSLHIRNASLVKIQAYAFSNMSSLEHLGLPTNEFLNIAYVQQALQRYDSNKFASLNLSGIHNATNMRPFLITEALLLPLSSLEVLDISWTKSRMSFHKFILLPYLKRLDISGTYLNHFDVDCIMIPFNLEHLEDFRMNYWPRLPIFHEWLWMTRNCSQKTIFQRGCYILPSNLKELHLYHADASKFIIDFEKDVCIKSTLQYLNIANLKINSSIGRITGLHHLKLIDISNTGFPFSLEIFLDMPSLEAIDASGNILYKTENESIFVELFQNNHILKQIHLSDNGFLQIPYDLFSQNKLLETIDLSWNRLQYLHLNLKGCSHLRRLFIDHNRLKYIDSSFTSYLDSIYVDNNEFVMSIRENSLICSCEDDSVKFATWIQKTNITIDGLDKLSCNASNGQEQLNSYNIMAALNCSNETALTKISISASKGKLKYIVGGLSGCVLCVVFLWTAYIFLKRKPCQQKAPEIQDYSLQERIVSDCEEPINYDRDNEMTTVPDSIYFIGLADTPFERNNLKPRFTAFLAYCHDDKDFVVSKLYSELQNQLSKYLQTWNESLLTVLYDKNFLPGQCTMDLCRTAVFSSCVTVAVVSNAFLKSSWCHYEMEAAIEAKVPIISVYLDISDTDRFPAIMKYIYHNHVRVFWPNTHRETAVLSDEEFKLIRDLAFSISTYVKQRLSSD